MVPPLPPEAAFLRDIALALPEATEEFPWGERAFKVRGKAFIFMRAAERISFSVKLPKSGTSLLQQPFAEATGYGLGRHGWVTVTLPKRVSKALRAECEMWIRESYRSVSPAALRKLVID